MNCSARRTGSSSGAPSGRSPYTGAYPALTSSALRSPSGTSSIPASSCASSRLGCARPVSRKLRWRVEMPASVARVSWLMPRASRQRRSSLPNEVVTPPSGNPSNVFIGVPNTPAGRHGCAITCQVKTRPRGGRFSLRRFFDVYEGGLDHQQVALARLLDHVEEPIHLDDLFQLLVDEPLEEALCEVVVLLDGDVHQRGDLTRDLFLPVQRRFDGFFGRLERRVRRGDGGDLEVALGIEDVLHELHRVHGLFFGLLEEEFRQQRELALP